MTLATIPQDILVKARTIIDSVPTKHGARQWAKNFNAIYKLDELCKQAELPHTVFYKQIGLYEGFAIGWRNDSKYKKYCKTRMSELDTVQPATILAESYFDPIKIEIDLKSISPIFSRSPIGSPIKKPENTTKSKLQQPELQQPELQQPELQQPELQQLPKTEISKESKSEEIKKPEVIPINESKQDEKSDRPQEFKGTNPLPTPLLRDTMCWPSGDCTPPFCVDQKTKPEQQESDQDAKSETAIKPDTIEPKLPLHNTLYISNKFVQPEQKKTEPEQKKPDSPVKPDSLIKPDSPVKQIDERPWLDTDDRGNFLICRRVEIEIDDSKKFRDIFEILPGYRIRSKTITVVQVKVIYKDTDEFKELVKSISPNLDGSL